VGHNERNLDSRVGEKKGFRGNITSSRKNTGVSVIKRWLLKEMRKREKLNDYEGGVHTPFHPIVGGFMWNVGELNQSYTHSKFREE